MQTFQRFWGTCNSTDEGLELGQKRSETNSNYNKALLLGPMGYCYYLLNILLLTSKSAREQALHLGIARGEGWITLTCELGDLKSENGLSSLEFNYNYYSILKAVHNSNSIFLFVWSVAPVERGNLRPHSKHLPNSFLQKRKISFGLLKLL